MTEDYLRHSELGYWTVRRSDYPVHYDVSAAQWDRLLNELRESNTWLIRHGMRIEMVATHETTTIYFPDEQSAFEFKMRWL